MGNYNFYEKKLMSFLLFFGCLLCFSLPLTPSKKKRISLIDDLCNYIKKHEIYVYHGNNSPNSV